jgi:hypothetical protein
MSGFSQKGGSETTKHRPGHLTGRSIHVNHS